MWNRGQAMNNYGCTYCEEEWNLDPIHGKEGDAEGLPFCCEECLSDYLKACAQDREEEAIARADRLMDKRADDRRDHPPLA